ncbi:MAG TPA: hypothetical protein ENN86_01095 [Desulfobacteraceae bacterium]|nr:hypothetical protein [Desulfobacteraceae bacterium]
MFRKLTHIAISALLLIATAGITVSKHYCGDDLMSVAVMNTPDACCDLESCCHNETQVFMLDNDFTYTSEEPVNIPEFKRPEAPGFKIIAFLPDNSSVPVFNDKPRPPRLRTYLASIQSFLL